jgi:parallel beta-helix repeat protein
MGRPRLFLTLAASAQPPGARRRIRGISFVIVATCLAVSSCSPGTPAGAGWVESPTARQVRVAGSGPGNGDGSADRPFRTIQQAVDAATPGNTVLVEAGDYDGFHVTRDHITVAAAPGAHVKVHGDSRDVISFEGVSGGGIDGLDVTGSRTQYGSGVMIDSSTGVQVRRSQIHDGRTFGIVVVRSSHVLLADNDIYHNADGIEERYASDLTIRANRIHDNLKEVDAGRGQEGINFYKSTGTVTVESNTLWDNGTHFEVYGASRLVFRDNVTHDGQVMETGTGDGLPCADNIFVRNVAYRGHRQSSGMILRCAQNMLVAHNVFDGFDEFAFDVIDGLQGVPYGGSVEHLRIVDNIVVRGRAYSIDNALPASVMIDHNLVYLDGSVASHGRFVAFVAGHGNTATLTEFTQWTGYDRHGLAVSPRFADRSGHDYHLIAGSPAVDQGLVVLDEPFLGAAPDLGRYELR